MGTTQAPPSVLEAEVRPRLRAIRTAVECALVGEVVAEEALESIDRLAEKALTFDEFEEEWTR